MTDQQQQAPSYPGFEMTTTGLEALYREFGRMAHQAFEAELKATKTTDLLRQVQAQMVMAPQPEPAVSPVSPGPAAPTQIDAKAKAKAGG